MKRNRLFAGIAIALAIALLALAGCSSGGNAAESSAGSSQGASSASAQANTAPAQTRHAELTVEGYDPVTIELDATAAPLTVENFCALADDGYYDGLTFYRFVEGFCMQGGTKGNNAAGNDSSLTPIKGEFSANGIENALADAFVKGTVAMARTQNPDSATSTFFITLDSSLGVSQSLNGQYAAFGTIDEAGMKVIDKIVAAYLPNVTDASMGAIADEANQAKITSIKIVD